MGPGRLALVGCLVATVMVAGCGTETTKSTSDALGWDCGDFRTASDAQHEEALKVLATEVAKGTGNPVGKGIKVNELIETLCKSQPADYVVGAVAVNAVIDSTNLEEVGPGSTPPSETSGGGAAPTDTPPTDTPPTGTPSTPTPSTEAPPTETPPTDPQCNDGTDNDGDGSIDFPADTYCSSEYDDYE